MVFSLKSKNRILGLGYLVAVITLVSIYLLAQSTEGSQQFEKNYYALLITIGMGIFCLFIIVSIYSVKLLSNYKKSIPGASLSLTILWRTLLLAIIPLLFLAFFAFKFLSYDFQTSFDEGIDSALNNSLILSQKALDNRALQALRDTNAAAIIIAPFEYIRLQSELEGIRNNIGAYELTVFDEKGFIQAFSGENRQVIVPNIPNHDNFLRVENEGGLFSIETQNLQFQIRTLTIINKPGAPNYYLQAIFHIPDTISDLTDQVSQTIAERDKFNYLKPKISSSFIYVLGLVLSLASLFLILSAINFANHMARPIRDLIRGTKKVSQGDFSQQLALDRKDDFGTLVNSFNLMTSSLKKATNEAEMNRLKVENERAYLATVINNMTSAVITLDDEKKLLTYNEYAEKLLDSDLSSIVFTPLLELTDTFAVYFQFISQLNIESMTTKTQESEITLTINKNQQQFIARITALPANHHRQGGFVVIFDDLTKYWEKQKQAAWEEVAKRLAHEIKNPLTPILLAAERLQYKLQDKLDENEVAVLNRSIEVITNQVKSLKNMVNDFSDFAKPVKTQKTPVIIHSLIQEINELYKDYYKNIQLTCALNAACDTVLGNESALRQVFHNLIKNAIESCDKQSNGEITITTSNTGNQLNVEVSDNGKGLPEDFQKLFDPYITTKEKGTGLGLAIVKKIIDEHHGNIQLRNRTTQSGAVAILTLPIPQEPTP